MRAEHEISTKSCRNWRKVAMRAEYEIGANVMRTEHENVYRGIQNRNGESGVVWDVGFEIVITSLSRDDVTSNYQTGVKWTPH